MTALWRSPLNLWIGPLEEYYFEDSIFSGFYSHCPMEVQTTCFIMKISPLIKRGGGPTGIRARLLDEETGA
jgi:hypothetical protein